MVNKTITMTISEIEKASNQFKKTHKIKVSGPYSDEQVPKWFKEYKEETNARFEKIDAKFEKIDAKFEQVCKWFKEYKEETNARFEKIDARFKQLDEQMPKWFEKWVELKFDPLVKRIDNIVEKNNLKE